MGEASFHVAFPHLYTDALLCARVASQSGIELTFWREEHTRQHFTAKAAERGKYGDSFCICKWEGAFLRAAMGREIPSAEAGRCRRQRGNDRSPQGDPRGWQLPSSAHLCMCCASSGKVTFLLYARSMTDSLTLLYRVSQVSERQRAFTA